MISKFFKGLATAAAVLAIGQTSARATQQILITSAASLDNTHSGAIGGGFIAQGSAQQGTGSGTIQSFVRIQQTGEERGYNTDHALFFDEKIGAFTHALTLGAVPIVTIGGIAYREFVLDKAQPSNGPISLNQIQIFTANSDAFHTGLTEATTNNQAIITFGTGTNEVFRLNAPTNSSPGNLLANSLEIVIDNGSGNGSAEMFFYVRSSVFGSASDTTNVILFSQFGRPPGQYQAEGSFEEWAVRQPGGGTPPPGVPEPGAVAFAISGLGTLALAYLRRSRKASA